MSPRTSMKGCYLHFLVLCACRIHNLFEGRVALNPGLSGEMGVTSTIISHEQTQ